MSQPQTQYRSYRSRSGFAILGTKNYCAEEIFSIILGRCAGGRTTQYVVQIAQSFAISNVDISSTW